MHGEYEQLLVALRTAVTGACLDQVIEVEGPNRLGGFRLSDGEHRIALSYLPSRKKDGKNWWVSAWFPMEDETDARVEASLIPMPYLRETVHPKPLTREDAILTALSYLLELRVRTAWYKKAQEEVDADLSIPFTELPETSTAVRDSVFSTARNGSLIGK